LLHIAIAENLLDHEFIATRTTGFENARKTAVAYWPERVERITGVPVHQLYETARMLGRARAAMILTARGAEQQSQSVNNLLALINLALALGKSGKPHCGFGCITGQGNGQGGREHGQKADQLPGYRSIEDAAAREHVAQVWRVAPSSLPRSGACAYEMLDSAGLDGGVRAMLVLGSNLAVSAPNLAHVRQRLSDLDFLVVADFFMSETARLADVVLPSAQWAEEEGTVTNLEGRVILRRRAAMPPAQVRTDLEILSMLADRLGCAAAFPTEAEGVFEELRRASAHGPADYSGISYKRLESQPGVFWPCPEESHPGTPRVFLDRYAKPDGRARFHAVEYRPPAELPNDDYPFFLTTGRVAAHYQSGTQTRLVARLMSAEREAYTEMHPAAARALGIADGDPVRVVTRRGAKMIKARSSTAIRMDTLFIPFHWPGEASANLLTNPALDSSSKMPEFKVCAARVERIATRGVSAALSARGGNTNSSK
jgi:assimilatory nitrate reductase catalytic subunit